MSIPTVVAQRLVIAGDKRLTVSTIRIAADYYDTAVFDDSPDKQHVGMLIGGYVIDSSSKRATTREGGMENHREALIAARDEQPTPTATQIAGLFLAAGADYQQITRQLTEDLGRPAARVLLAQAHSTASEQLWNAA
ncbi:hypothetical protein ACIREK_30890 [Streptomyces sp. NPDC102415]|uniref:hypothetical protein n=1 Tax=Streptomyces sp. NPDC102415 TaxID=3366173 RepID=UPI0038128C39